MTHTGSSNSTEAFDIVIQDFITFVNGQQGMYMDALAGLAGHHTETERQAHRESRPVGTRLNRKGERVVVWASYEDPSKPDIIHHRIIRAVDYIAINAAGGSNEQQHAQAVLVFLYTYWELETRPRLAAAKGCDTGEIRADIMGDLRILRNVILHAKGIMRPDALKSLKKLGAWFTTGEPIHISFERMKQILIWVHQACAFLLFEWRGLPDARAQAEQIVSLAIQNPGQ